MHWNVTAHPTAPWVWRQIIAATPWNTAPRFLIRDRDRNYAGDFVPKAAALGIETILTPVRAPKANAIAERVIGTIRRDCLDHLIVLTERHLQRVLREYVAYYNDTRPHQSLGDQPPSGPRTPTLRGGRSAWQAGRFWVAYTMNTSGRRRDGVLEHHTPIHDRMPVILTDDAVDTWLQENPRDLDPLKSLLTPPPDDLLAFTPASPRVNNVRNDDPGIMEVEG